MIKFVCFVQSVLRFISYFFFFNDTATTEIYTLSLHDALPILAVFDVELGQHRIQPGSIRIDVDHIDRKSTRLNSSHSQISYAVFCLKKKKKTNNPMVSPTTQITNVSLNTIQIQQCVTASNAI